MCKCVRVRVCMQVCKRACACVFKSQPTLYIHLWKYIRVLRSTRQVEDLGKLLDMLKLDVPNHGILSWCPVWTKRALEGFLSCVDQQVSVSLVSVSEETEAMWTLVALHIGFPVCLRDLKKLRRNICQYTMVSNVWCCIRRQDYKGLQIIMSVV